ALVEALIDHNAKLDPWSFLIAAQAGHIDVVQFLFARGKVTFTWSDADGRTALHGAAENGREAMVDLLRTNGLDIEARDNDEKTPLHLAAAEGQVGTLQMLLDDTRNWPKSDADAADFYGRTPLHDAAAAGRDAVVEPLRKAGATVDARDRHRLTPLHHAANGG